MTTRGRPPTRRRGLGRPQASLTLLLIVFLAAYLRFTNLATNPGWDGDEGYNWNIAANLAAGHVRMFALNFAFVQHPPLFFLLGAAAFRLLGSHMVVLRGLAVCCSLLVLPLLFVLGRAVGSPTAGLLAAGLYAISPQIVIQNRFAYTYNLLSTLTLGALCLMVAVVSRLANGPAEASPSTRRALAAAGLVTGLALATDQEALYLLPPLAVLLYVWRQRCPGGARDIARTIALAAVPPALYIAWMLVLRPAAFLFDIAHTAGRVGGGSALVQLYLLAFNLTALLRFDVWIPLGLAGLLLVRHAAQRGWILLVLLCVLLVVLKVRTPNPLFRTAEPLWPFVVLGLGLVTEAVAKRLYGTVVALVPGTSLPRAAGRAAVLLALAPVALVSTVTDLASVRARLVTPIDSTLPRSPTAALALARYINVRVGPRDVVLAMPQISWLLHCRTAEILQAVAITGQATAFYPAGLGARRWAYDVHLERARYLVVDDFTRAWIGENPGERALVEHARARWRVVYRGGEYTVYANPARATRT